MAGDEFSLVPPVHCCSCRVLYADTDAGGVVYYGNYLRFFEIGRTEFMRQSAMPYRELAEAGVILPVADCRIRYKASARYDDLLLIETALAELKPVSCRFHYRISRQDDGKPLALGYTVNVAVDRQGKLSKLPAELRQRLANLAAR